MFSLYLDEEKDLTLFSATLTIGGTGNDNDYHPKHRRKKKKKYNIQLLTIENDVVQKVCLLNPNKYIDTVVYGVHLSLKCCQTRAADKGSSDLQPP